MSIFANPQKEVVENPYGVKILYLHGLESSSQGTKALALKKTWSAFTPNLRTKNVETLRKKCAGNWKNVSFEEINEAMTETYQDALDAVNYLKPDIIVGSSLGAAILYRLYANEHYDKASVLLAPAIPHLLTDQEIQDGSKMISNTESFWILGELDTIVSNSINSKLAAAVGGNLIYSSADEHRLPKALETGLINSGILTVIENLNRS